MNYTYYTHHNSDGTVAHGIKETTRRADNDRVFDTFVKARAALVSEFEARAIDYKALASYARNLRPGDVEKLHRTGQASHA